MKILKPGKVEQRKFTCPKCGCVFTAIQLEMEQNGRGWFVVCPQDGCGYNFAAEGEPYEEPELLTQSDVERLAELLQHDDGSWSSMDFADFLLSHGVTFKEE